MWPVNRLLVAGFLCEQSETVHYFLFLDNRSIWLWMRERFKHDYQNKTKIAETFKNKISKFVVWKKILKHTNKKETCKIVDNIFAYRLHDIGAIDNRVSEYMKFSKYLCIYDKHYFVNYFLKTLLTHFFKENNQFQNIDFRSNIGFWKYSNNVWYVYPYRDRIVRPIVKRSNNEIESI